MGLDNYIQYDDDNGYYVELCYRKQFWLKKWMTNNTSLPNGANSMRVRVSRNKVGELYELCQKVLNEKDPVTAEKTFPQNDYYDDYFFEDLKSITEDLKEILKNVNLKEIEYYDSW